MVLFGPPAVGKMTVGRALEERTGLPLFHNHMTIELVLPFFDFGSEPFTRLVGGFRRSLFEEVAASDRPGLIFTYVWAFDQPGDRRFVEEVVEIFAAEGGRTVFVELQADLQTRLWRNTTELRLAHKPSKRDVAASNARLRTIEEACRMSSDGRFPFPEHHLHIDNTRREPAEVAERIADRFGLPRVSRPGAPTGRPDPPA